MKYPAFPIDQHVLSNLIFSEQPLGDAIHYKNHHVIKLLEEHGAKPPVSFIFRSILLIKWLKENFYPLHKRLLGFIAV